MHELYISCMWRLLFRVTSTFLARCARWNNLRCYWLDFCSGWDEGVEGLMGWGGERRGENKYKSLTILTTICSKIKTDLYIKETGCAVRLSSSREPLGFSSTWETIWFLGFQNKKYIYVVGGSSSERAQFALDKHFACPMCSALQHTAELLSVKPALTFDEWEMGDWARGEECMRHFCASASINLSFVVLETLRARR